MKKNSWGVSYSIISFFETTLNGHKKVRSVLRSQDIVFNIVRDDGTQLCVLLVNEYILGLAAILRARMEFPAADIIVTGGNWNGYTREAKEYGAANAIGVFNTGEFFGALHWSNPKAYVKKDQNGKPEYNYK